MPDTHFDVLFICSGNSARPIFAEALLRDLGRGRFQAFSAGTRPGTDINPLALKVLKDNRQDIAGLRSKHVSEFQRPGAPVMDFVFTVCDLAAAEECPPWPGQPISGHWGLPDPIRAQGTEAERGLALAQTYAALRHRVSTFVALPFETLDRIALQAQVDRVARPRMPSPMSDRPRIALNGLGRIGKLALRDLVDSGAGGRSGSSTTPRPTPSNTPCFWSSTASTAAGRGRSAMSPARSPSRAGASA